MLDLFLQQLYRNDRLPVIILRPFLVFGENQRATSMAKTVGLPVAIAVKLILNGIINSTGVKIPTTKDIYIPVLKELSENGINFIEEEIN